MSELAAYTIRACLEAGGWIVLVLILGRVALVGARWWVRRG